MLQPVRVEPTDRRNNLNLIRLLAALAVMVSHAWPIVFGAGAPEPLAATGYTLGTLAVMVFFGLSGFLIAASWHRDPDPWRFLVRRGRRLFPGLWAMLVVSALVLGPIVSTLGVGEYLGDPGTWRFLWQNALLLPIEPALPGVFTGNPYPAAAGSIWTLHYEALCYLALLLAGMMRLLRSDVAVWLAAAVLALSIGAGLWPEQVHPRVASLIVLGLPFTLGAAAWSWRNRIVLGWPGIVLLVLAAWAARDGALYHPLVAAAVVYATLWVGYVPWRIGAFVARTDDLSYGIYLYAFPVQGLVQHLTAPQDVPTHLALAVPPTVVLAILSWRWIERPWLRSGANRRGGVVQRAPTFSTRAPDAPPR